MSYELGPEDNNRLYELEQDLLKIGDARVGIAESDLQNPQAQALREQGLTLLQNARTILDRMYEAELAQARNNVTHEETN